MTGAPSPDENLRYARLSFRVGVFAGRADRFLGRPHFGTKARAVPWTLTPELLDEWRQEARALGVPEEVLPPQDEASE